ncbi:MAG: DUF975 family protein [Peptostreptococcaceae bacterium]
MSRSELKNLSKSQLKGHFKVPVLLTLIYGAIVFAVSFSQNFSNSAGVAFLCFLLTLAIEVWAVVGFPNFYLRFIENNDETKFKDFFVSKGLLLKSLGYVIFMSLIGALIGLIIGLTLISSVSYSVLGYATFTGTAWMLGLIMLAICAVVIVFSISIAMTAYILVDKGMKVFEAIGLSMRMMKGHKWEFFVLYLSFIGWAILCILTLGIGYLWLAPYISLTFANFYKELDKNYVSI